MSITAQHVSEILTGYLDAHPEDKADLAVVTEVLEQAGDLIASRKEFRGHITAGAVLLRSDGRVLTIEHRALQRWLLPGGHVQDSDDSLDGAALRELVEETGIAPTLVTLAHNLPVHVDVHPIPANFTKGERAHQHFDFRYLFRTTVDEVALQLDEVSAFSWRPAGMALSESMRGRMIATAGRGVIPLRGTALGSRMIK